MLFWKSLCGTVLMVTVSPDFCWKALTMLAMARLGTSSEPEDPSVADLEAEALPPALPVVVLAPVQAPRTEDAADGHRRSGQALDQVPSTERRRDQRWDGLNHRCSSLSVMATGARRCDAHRERLEWNG